MKRNIILFGAFLSAFILILVPSIGCVNANIQNENNLSIKNINIDDIKTIINRLKDSDCNCHKTINQNNDNGWGMDFLCMSLLIIFIAICSPFIWFEMYGNVDMELLFKFILLLYDILMPIAYPFFGMAIILNCEWTNWMVP